MALPVDIAPDVVAALQDRATTRQVRKSVVGAVRALLADDLAGRVRPWDLPALRARAATLGEVNGARVVGLRDAALVVELLPGGQRVVLRRVDDGWRLVRFVEGADDGALRPERTRHVTIDGWGPPAVLDALGIELPDGVELQILTRDLGQGETETCYRYQWVDGDRSVLVEEVKNEIYDGATPYSTHVRGVVIDGAHGLLLTGSGDSAVVVEG